MDALLVLLILILTANVFGRMTETFIFHGAEGHDSSTAVNGIGFEITIASDEAFDPRRHLVARPGDDDRWELFGFVVGRTTLEWRNEAVVQKFWHFGLPWWSLVAVIYGRHFYRSIYLWGEAAQARRLALDLAWHKEEAVRRIRAFDRDPLCELCGYDLRATRNRCPECGWIPGPELQPQKGNE